MRKLTKIIVPALAALAAVGTAGAASAHPNAAHPYAGHPYAARYAPAQVQHVRYDDARHHTPARAQAIRNQIDELQRRIDRNDWRGRISDREARGLRKDVARLQNQFRDYNRNGLSNREMNTLQNRINNIRTRLRIERNDWDNRRW